MSTREYVNKMLDGLSEEQLKELVMLLNGFFIADDVPNTETIEAINEVEEMKKNPNNYKSYSSAEDMFKKLLQ